MAIIPFTFDPHNIKDFIQFGYEHYRRDEKWIPPLKKNLYSQFSPEFYFYVRPGNKHQHFLATIGERVIGRISAFINQDLRDKNNRQVGILGFYECIDDPLVSEDLLGAAIKWIFEYKAIDCVWGPMNFDIWHGYRMMTRGFDQTIFIGEPYNKPYYADQFERFGFYVKQHWHSLELHGQDTLRQIVNPGANRYQELVDQGYRFEFFNLKRFYSELRKLYSILPDSFCRFLGYTPISFEQFAKIFNPNRYAFHPRLFTFIYDQDNILVGFAGAFLDVAESLRKMNGNDNLINKLKFLYTRRLADRVLFFIGGITPYEAAKRSGLGKAGFYYLMHQILNEGYEKVILAIMASGSRVRGLISSKEKMAQRQYTLFELKSEYKFNFYILRSYRRKDKNRKSICPSLSTLVP
jgi:hypothetical protein